MLDFYVLPSEKHPSTLLVIPKNIYSGLRMLNHDVSPSLVEAMTSKLEIMGDTIYRYSHNGLNAELTIFGDRAPMFKVFMGDSPTD